MKELFKNKVRYIIGKADEKEKIIKGTDGLTLEFLENDIIKKYVENPKCSIILYENPPYSDTSSISHQKLKIAKESSFWKNKHVVNNYNKKNTQN